MNYRHMVAVSLFACIAAGCSLTPKDQAAEGADQTSPDHANTELMEVPASSKPPLEAEETLIVLNQPGKDAASVKTPKRVEFVFSSDDKSLIDSHSTTVVNASYTPESGPVSYAPSYSERPVPARGETQETVVAELGQPPHRLPGNAGNEVWDYGTFRVFFQNEKVAFTRVW